MQCTGCGFEARADFAFCPKCGRKLPTACLSCGSVCLPDFSFCPRCGVRLAAVSVEQPATPAAEAGPTSTQEAVPSARAAEGAAEAARRLVSVLFADLSGFTALSERLDPEDVRAFQSDLFREMASVIERYEGFVEKFVGDAVMAVFGAPVAHEDDPERALRAALAMHERMERLNRRWESCLGTLLALHIGVNTGPVVAGHFGPTAGAAYAVTGDTVNTASRLHGAAQPGQTLVSATTYSLAQHTFDFELVGDMALKGKTEPLRVYRVLRILDARRSARGLESYSLVAPLVGRDDELGQILAAFDRMLRGRAQVVSLIGEAGLGKSRLLSEFFVQLASGEHLQRTVVRRAACAALGEQTYGVLAAFLREAYGVAPDDTLQVAQSMLISGLRALGADEDEATSIAPLIGHLLGLRSGNAEWRHANLAVAYCTFTNRCDEEGIGAAQTAIELDRRLGQLDHLAVPLIVLGQIYQCQRKPDLALSHYREALGLAEEIGEPQLLFPCYEGLATLYLEMGDEAQAEQYLLRAQQVCERAGLDPDALVMLPFLG